VLLLLGAMLAALAFILSYSFQKFVPGQLQTGGFTLENYGRITEGIYRGYVRDTIVLAAGTTLFTLVLSYPVAYALARSRSRWLRTLILVLTILPFFTGAIVRTYSWILVLGSNGFINAVLRGLHLRDEPLQMMFTKGGVLVALVQYSMPVMIVMLAASISQIDASYEMAAESLGAGPVSTFGRVTLPLSLPGIVSGSLVVFAWTFSAFPTPELIGGGKVKMIANVVNDLALQSFNFPSGAAFAVFALTVTLALVTGLTAIATRRLAHA